MEQPGILENKLTEIPIRSYAHIGDAVYEVYIREKTIFLTSKSDILHKLTIYCVNAEFQAELLDYIQTFLTDEEKDLVRRARNLQVTTSRRTNQKIHRLSTAFEALVGHSYLTDKSRLKELFSFIDPYINEKLAQRAN